MFRLCLFFILSLSIPVFSQQVSGIVTDDEGNPLAATLVFNMKTEQKAYSTASGQFSINASVNEELRFIRAGYERNFKIIGLNDYSNPLRVIIVRDIQEIEEVIVPAVKLTGDLNRDSKNLARFDKVAQLQAEIGVPEPPEKPREIPSEVGKNILLPLIGYPPTIDVQAIYNVLSGKAKRQKRLYNYDDLQDKIMWIRIRVDDQYFIKVGIPEQKINEYLQFSIGIKPDINRYIKAQNLSKILFILEQTFPKYLNR